MRTIKFRAKRKDNGEWVYGAYFCIHHDDGRTHLHHFIIPENVPIPKDKPIGEIQVEIDPKTLDQFMGYTDMDGKEVYENDILSQETSRDKLLYQINYQEASLSYLKVTKGELNPAWWPESMLINGRLRFYKVIGNKRDNPDLGAKISGKTA
ncbi:MAG: hypothetical protein HF308_19150 [Ignavibacteria bacterium]|jgi:uncharacterized phage protein (TIGR01671 family)|nr:hypothetical protein [Ignavibacteria bacterium]MCU7526598.1 hypothetical protein [Ignavibacteria bacterium]